MTERQLDHFFDLSQLLAAASDVIITDSIECFFFFLMELIVFVYNYQLGCKEL
jgi:hypothetical protein